MSQAGAQYRRRAAAFERLIEATTSERWSAPSPCVGWTAADVVAHVCDWSAQVLSERAGVADAPLFAQFDTPLEAFRVRLATPDLATTVLPQRLP